LINRVVDRPVEGTIELRSLGNARFGCAFFFCRVELGISDDMATRQIDNVSRRLLRAGAWLKAVPVMTGIFLGHAWTKRGRFTPSVSGRHATVSVLTSPQSQAYARSKGVVPERMVA